MSILRAVIRTWLPLAAAIVCLSGLIYLIAQQSIRSAANEPQIQLAEDAARAMQTGSDPAALVNTPPVEISSSLAPYLMIYDAQGKLLASGSALHGQPPELPVGVLEASRASGENRVSWQPENGVRSALVVASIQGGSGGYVAAGRSLRETEKRVDQLGLLALLGCAATLGGSLAVGVVVELLLARWKNG